jgi:hypothetical protein
VRFRHAPFSAAYSSPDIDLFGACSGAPRLQPGQHNDIATFLSDDRRRLDKNRLRTRSPNRGERLKF